MAIVGETPKQRLFKQLATSMPIANQQAAQGVQEAQKISLQQQLAAAPAGMSYRSAQQAGASAAAAQGETAVKGAQTTQSDLTQIGQLGLQEQGRQLRQEAAAGELALGREQVTSEDRLAKLGSTLKAELFDKQMQFKTDEMGRARLNDRQLVDWAIMKAKTGEEFSNYEQMARQTAARQEQVMKMAYQKIEQALQQGYLKENQILDQKSKLTIAQIMADAKKAEEKRLNAAKNKAAMWQAGGMVAGGVAGAFGGPATAAAGASAGGGVGSVIGALS